MPAPRPEPYEPRRRHVDTVEDSSGIESLDGRHPRTAWWEWPFVVVFVPLRWVGRGVETVAEAAADLIDRASRVIGRVCDLLLLRPLRVVLRMLMRPARWLGRGARSLLQTPAGWMRAARRRLARGLSALFQTTAAALAWVFRPVAMLVEHVFSSPIRFVARTLSRSWRAAGRLGSLIWRTATRPVRWLARSTWELMVTPLRRLNNVRIRRHKTRALGWRR